MFALIASKRQDNVAQSSKFKALWHSHGTVVFFIFSRPY